MRQTHLGGEKILVDFAGDTSDIFEPVTGEARPMKLFVAALGASNYIYAEACPSESLPDWIGLHINLIRFLDGVPKFVVCVSQGRRHQPRRYAPGLTGAMRRWRAITAPQFSQPGRDSPNIRQSRGRRANCPALGLGAAAQPALLFPGRAGRRHPLLVPELNPRRMRGFGSSRAELLAGRSTGRSWENCRISHTCLRAGSIAASPDCHAKVEGHWYSTPYCLIRELGVSPTRPSRSSTWGSGSPANARALNRRRHTALTNHMPSAHRR